MRSKVIKEKEELEKQVQVWFLSKRIIFEHNY